MTRSSPYVTDILSLPPDDRLPYAIDVIRALTEVSDFARFHYRREYGLSATEAAVLNLLVQRAPRPVTKEAIFEAIWGLNSDTSTKIVDVYVCRIRSKLPDRGIIRTVWGEGYLIRTEDAEAIRPAEPEPGIALTVKPAGRGAQSQGRQNTPWTEQEDADLRRMAQSGSDLWAMAAEFERSERAVRARLTVLNESIAATAIKH